MTDERPPCPKCHAPYLLKGAERYWEARWRDERASADEVLGYAQRLAIVLWEMHWKDAAPDWKPLPDLMGVITQIDNMTSGLKKP